MVYFHFDDIIKVDRVDVDGKKYDRVSRIEAHSEELKMQLQLDINTELCHVRVGNKFRMILADTLNEDGSAGLPEGKQKSLADKFEYVMHGLLYQISEDDKSGSGLEKMITISFGGLLLMLKGEATKMERFKVHQNYFILLNRV